MDYTPTDSTPLSPSDFVASNPSADSPSNLSATQQQAVKAAAIEKAQNFRSYAGEKAAAIKQEAGAKFKQGAERAKELHETAEDYIRENPTKAVLGAVGVGVIIGLILRR